MKRILYFSIILVLVIVSCLFIFDFSESESRDRSNNEIINEFESNADNYRFIGENLILFNEEVSIYEKNKKIIIECSSPKVKQEIEDNEELSEHIKQIIGNEEIYKISKNEQSVFFELSRPPDDYHGSFIYDPQKKLQHSKTFLTPIDENWFLEMLPNM